MSTRLERYLGFPNEFRLVKRVSKHQSGTHDQLTHGNWADKDLIAAWQEPQGKTRNSPPNPQGTNARALYSWIEGPVRGSTMNYPANDFMRHVAHGLLGLPLVNYNALPRLASGMRMYHGTVVDQTKNLIESLHNAPEKQPVLWRGQNSKEGSLLQGETQGEYAALLDLKVGDTFISPLFSTSRKKSVAEVYADHLLKYDSETPPAIVFRIEAGAKGLRSSTIPMDAEVITGGKFRVTGRATTEIKSSVDDKKSHPLIILNLKQEDTFSKDDYVNPSFTYDQNYENL